ncbi:probable extracellular solute-binding protein, family 1 [Crocosphaera subtropica ATCC 51142]|uniref:Probable extracellular solute-binding protein, family 1 n=2 Tax=Crocosphaera TaxID=263510 RepID=B1WR54_CROS5|nr:probable extracellular solute-binding protein, family 1 [Crocosphaera subtropica ATCC 51142]
MTLFSIKMKVKNLFFSIILITLLLINACASHPINKLETKKVSPKGAILLWVEMPLGLTEQQSIYFKDIANSAIAQFTKLNPGVKISLKFILHDEQLSKFDQDIARGAGPDIFSVSLTDDKIPSLINSGYLKNLDKENIDLSKFRPETLKQVSYQNQLYAIPVRLGTQVLCYNKNKVQETPKTLDELIIQARRGYSVGLHSNFTTAFWGTGAFGGQLFDESGRIILGENQGWVQWMKWLKNAQNEPNVYLIEDAETLQEAFIQERLTYMTCVSSWLPILSEALDTNNIGVALLPGQENQPATPPLWTVGLIFNRASSENQHQLALKIAQFLTNTQYQQQLQVKAPFLIPVNKNAKVDSSLFPKQAVLFEQSKRGIILSLDQLEKNKVIFEYGSVLYDQVIAGEITPEEAALQIQQAVNNQFD